MLSFVYIVVYGDYRDRDRKYLGGEDKFYRFVFNTEEKAKKFVSKELYSVAETLDDPNYRIPARGIRIGECYDIVDDKFHYDYIRIRKHDLL